MILNAADIPEESPHSLIVRKAPRQREIERINDYDLWGMERLNSVNYGQMRSILLKLERLTKDDLEVIRVKVQMLNHPFEAVLRVSYLALKLDVGHFAGLLNLILVKEWISSRGKRAYQLLNDDGFAGLLSADQQDAI